MKVVDLADEFGLTTAEAIDACLWAGVPADSSATELTDDDAEQVRNLISGWIDAGFVPWRSQGEPHPGTLKNPGARTAGTTGGGEGGAPPPAPRSGDGSTTTLEPPNARLSGTSPTTSPDGADGTGPAAVAGADTETAGDPRGPSASRPDGDDAPRTSAPIGPRLPPSRGGPTGWLPGGPDAQARIAPLAIVALALAITSLVIPFVTAVLAIVLASIAKDRIASSRGWTKGTKLATAAQVVAGVGVGLWLVLLAGQFFFLQNQSNDQDVSDIQVELDTIPYEAIRLGDCVRLPTAGDISHWTTVKCDESHRAEVFAKLPVSNALGTNYPGDAPMQLTAAKDCREQLSKYMQDGIEEPKMETGFAYPSRKTWVEKSDRTIWCVAFRSDGSMLGKTIRSPNVQLVEVQGN